MNYKNKDVEKVGLEEPSEAVFWIKKFVILQSLQGRVGYWAGSYG